MKRRHHNREGHRRTKRDKRQDEVERMTRRIFGNKVRKMSDKLFIKGD